MSSPPSLLAPGPISAATAALPSSALLDLLQTLPTAIYATDSGGRITHYNEAAVQLWGVRPEPGDAQWCGSWRLYWPDGQPMAREECAMAEALKTGRPIAGAEAIAERPDGSRVAYLAYPTPLWDETGTLIGGLNMLVEITNRRRVEVDADLLASIVEYSHDAIISKDLSGIITTWNRGAEQLFGYTADEIIGKSITTLIPPGRHDEEPEILRRLRRGERIDHYETIRQRKDGSLIDISLTVSPIRNADGRVIGASKIARDITDRKRHQIEQELLLREMSHRIKNLFAVTNGLVGLSARAARTPAEMAQSLRERLGALSRAQGLTRIGLIENAELDRETTLHALIKTIFAPYLETQQGERLVVRGCDVSIRSNAITSLALVLHEFATNAVKHGSLSSPEGRVDIDCSVETNILRLQWQEQGGPPIKEKPMHRGFGSALAERTIAGQFGGQLSEEWSARGLIIDLTMPLDHLAAEPA